MISRDNRLGLRGDGASEHGIIVRIGIDHGADGRRLYQRGLFLADDMKQRTDHGSVGYPEQASAEKGLAFLAAAIARTAEVVQALLRRPSPD